MLNTAASYCKIGKPPLLAASNGALACQLKELDSIPGPQAPNSPASSFGSGAGSGSYPGASDGVRNKRKAAKSLRFWRVLAQTSTNMSLRQAGGPENKGCGRVHIGREPLLFLLKALAALVHASDPGTCASTASACAKQRSQRHPVPAQPPEACFELCRAMEFLLPNDYALQKTINKQIRKQMSQPVRKSRRRSRALHTW